MRGQHSDVKRENSMIRVGNAPCSWGVIEGIEGAEGHPDQYPAVLDEMRETGYSGTELGDWGFMPTEPARLRDELRTRDLALIGSWVSVFLHDQARHEESARDAVRTARQLAAVGGPQCVIVLGNDPYGDPMRTQNAGRITPEMAMDEATWKVFAAGATLVARAVKDETGLRAVFHHHIGTWVETPRETRRLMEMTDPNLLGLCFDTGHCQFGGGDPVTMIDEYAGRIWHVHFKDCSPEIAARSRVEEWDGVTAVGHGVFCELGKGGVQFPAVRDALDKIGYDGWIVVEQDVLPGMGAPKESARRNRDYLTSIGL
jgi:inosose dehydratase